MYARRHTPRHTYMHTPRHTYIHTSMHAKAIKTVGLYGYSNLSANQPMRAEFDRQNTNV